MGFSKHIGKLPAALQQPMSIWVDRMGERLGAIDESVAGQLLQVAASSEFAARQILRETDWVLQALPQLDAEPIDQNAANKLSLADIKTALRRYRNRTMLGILWRELHATATLDDTLNQLSALADDCLSVATQWALHNLAARHGRVRNAAGAEVPLVILGMGKLGGRELNFSSDIDLIFCYSENGESDGSKCLSAQEYFGKLSQLIISLLDDVTPDGFVFRIDTRLRPFGDSGPPVVSFAALENYLLQHGRDWERYAYVKARIVGLQPGEMVAGELYDDLIRPFVYRRYLDFGVFESLREMHAMIAAEVERRDLIDNIKLGPGGIREIEFIVQALQLVRGGSEPHLQGRELMQVVPRLVNNRGLSEQSAQELLDAYRFLRRLENSVQALRDEQTHELPAAETDQARVCLALGFDRWGALTASLERHRDIVTRQFGSITLQDDADSGAQPSLFADLWETNADAAAWQQALAREDVDQAQELAREMEAFSSTGAIRQADAASQQRLQRLIPKLLAAIATTARPLPALRRCLAVVQSIARRSAYISLLNENPMALARLVELCERSQMIADQLARQPALLDELLDARGYSAAIKRQDLATELADRLGDESDSELRMQRTAQFQRAATFRIAIADFGGSLPIMRVSDGLTWLAETVVEEALRVAMSDLVARHGEPSAGFGVIAYGKLGGLELSYGSDLDVVFLHNTSGGEVTDGEAALENSVFFSRLVRRLVHFLTTQTGSGELYEVDTRLRPDGRSGLLVSGVDGFEKYQIENAWTWEHQALLRARPIAGDPSIARAFARIRHETLTKRIRRDTLRDDVVSMRARMRSELDRSDGQQFDLKHGPGGLGDIEFLVQYLVLQQAGRHPEVIEFTDNIRQLDALMAVGIIDTDVGEELQNCYREYRTRVHHQALDDLPPLVSATAFRELRQGVERHWKRWLG